MAGLRRLRRRTIAIAGNIGVGKIDVGRVPDAAPTASSPYYEPSEDNPYLPDFYTDMRRWAFHSQLYFLSSKFRLHQELDRAPGVVALDRTIFEDAEVFAVALREMKAIDDRDWATYRSFYETILGAIRPPDLLIYLKCSVRTLRKRIRLRDRQMERAMPLSYLRRLHRLYESWVDSYHFGDVLVLESDRLDYVNDLVHRLDVMERIEALLPPELGKRTSEAASCQMAPRTLTERPHCRRRLG